jgi:hypothetical protein
MSGFDIEKIFAAAIIAIQDFAKEHREETFYAFSIDASLLCLNSIEKLEKTLKKYQTEYPASYQDSEEIDSLKYNTGDWDYQGFYTLKEGFDEELYNEHYDIAFEHMGISDAALTAMQQDTPYHHAMSSLLEKLIDSKAFDCLKKTDDFRAFLSEHNY